MGREGYRINVDVLRPYWFLEPRHEPPMDSAPRSFSAARLVGPIEGEDFGTSDRAAVIGKPDPSVAALLTRIEVIDRV